MRFPAAAFRLHGMRQLDATNRPTIDDGPMGWAQLMRAIGGHCLADLVQYFRLPDIPEVGVERDEFEEARRRLARAGFRLQDADVSLANFSRLRMEYAGRVNALAWHWATPPAQCISDWSPLRQPRLHTLRPTVTPPVATTPP